MDERLTYNVSKEQIEKINSGDRAAMDEFFFSNQLRIKCCAYCFMKKNRYFKTVISWEDLVNEFYVSLCQGLFLFQCNDKSITRCIFHSFRYAAVGGMEDTVFKYATKGVFKSGDEDEIALGGYDFMALLPALYGRRVIQGYGLLNALDFEVSEKESAEQEQHYLKILSKLREVEAPKRTFAYLSGIRKELERKTTTYISKSSLHELTAEDYET